MGVSKALVAFVLLSLLVVNVAQALESKTIPNQVSGNGAVTGATTGSVPLTGAKIDCGAACGVRCSKTKRPNLCKRSCGTCCNRCNCVPPGTSGNYEACSCYANLKTHGNLPKCP